MLTRGKRKRVEHQASTLRGIFPIPRDVLNILKRMWSPLDWFMLCEAFGCHEEARPPSDARLLKWAIEEEEDNEHLVEWLLSSYVCLTKSLRKNDCFVDLAALMCNLNVLKLLKRYGFTAGPNAVKGIPVIRGDVECLKYLVDVFHCTAYDLFCNGHASLIAYKHTKCGFMYVDWREELLYAIHHDRADAVVYIRAFAPSVFLNLYDYFMMRRSAGHILCYDKETFFRAILKYDVRLSYFDLRAFRYTPEQSNWIHEALEKHGDFFLSENAKDYLRSGFVY